MHGKDSLLMLKDSGFHVFAENGTEDIHDFTEGGIGFDRLDDGRHGVLSSLCSTAQVLQAALHSGLVALFAYTVEPPQVGPLAYLVNVEGRHPDLLIHDIVVHTDDSTLVLVDLLLVTVRRLGDF